MNDEWFEDIIWICHSFKDFKFFIHSSQLALDKLGFSPIYFKYFTVLVYRLQNEFRSKSRGPRVLSTFDIRYTGA